MTRRLILIRHAKSSWDDPRLADHDRVLNSRGITACRLIGDWLAAHDHQPDEALVSDAARTQETWSRIAARLGPVPALRHEPRLYHAGAEMMLTVLRGATGRTVAMVGHNPGIAEFAARLLRLAPDHGDFRRYPTGATLVADFAVADWGALVPASGEVVDFVTPRELDGRRPG